MKKIFVFLPFVVILVLGCSSNVPPQVSEPVTPHIEDSQVFKASFDRVWNAVVDFLAKSDFEIKAIEKESGLIVAETTEMNIERDFTNDQFLFICPLIPGAHWWIYRGVVNILVKPAGENVSRVIVRSRFYAFEDGKFRAWFPCISKGVIERIVFDEIGLRLCKKKVCF